MKKCFLFQLLFCFIGLVALAQEVATPSPSSDDAGKATEKLYVMCRQQAVVRTLRIATLPNGSCLATYTKDGVDQEVARSRRLETCKSVLGKIRENIESAGWKCKDVSQARVSADSTE